MTQTGHQDHRQATAERNVGAVLDAAERLLQDGRQPTLSAVATEAGVSRPTVYAHFGDRRQLVEAVVARAIQAAMATLEEAEPDRGPPVEALRRVVEAGWEQLARHVTIARAAAAELHPDGAIHRAHHQAHHVLERLISRGRNEGAFRADLPERWLVTASMAVIHGAATSVASGEMDEQTARNAVTTTVVDLCAATAQLRTD